MSPRIACLVGLAASPLAAQNGGQRFLTHYSACHATDGQDATVGTFPPLTGSPWLNNDAALAIQIVLHGLAGPVELLGKTYNLAMPPQGAVLADAEIAAILSYARSSWGNRSSVVTPAENAAARNASAGRTKPRTASEPLQLYPLVIEQSALTDLTSQTPLRSGTRVDRALHGLRPPLDRPRGRQRAIDWRSDRQIGQRAGIDNGGKVAEPPWPVTPSAMFRDLMAETPTAVYLGCDGKQAYMVGRLDHFRAFKIAQSDEEILKHP